MEIRGSTYSKNVTLFEMYQWIWENLGRFIKKGMFWKLVCIFMNAWMISRLLRTFLKREGIYILTNGRLEKGLIFINVPNTVATTGNVAQSGKATFERTPIPRHVRVRTARSSKSARHIPFQLMSLAQ
jgi:hypothetical protein